MMETYRAVISASVEITATVKEYDNGEIEIIEIDEITEVEDFENVRRLD